MRIVKRKLADIVPYERNPRRNEAAIEAVAASIREFGFRQPIVVDKQGVIVAGHTRFAAAKRLGLEAVPVVVADDLTPEQVRAYRIADNSTAEKAEWDLDLLALELDALKAADYDLAPLSLDPDILAPKAAEAGGGEIEDGFQPSEPAPEGESDTMLVLGEYRIPVERDRYEAWRTGVIGKVGPALDAIKSEILRRIGL